jgi:hypothetical protein
MSLAAMMRFLALVWTRGEMFLTHKARATKTTRPDSTTDLTEAATKSGGKKADAPSASAFLFCATRAIFSPKN